MEELVRAILRDKIEIKKSGLGQHHVLYDVVTRALVVTAFDILLKLGEDSKLVLIPGRDWVYIKLDPDINFGILVKQDGVYAEAFLVNYPTAWRLAESICKKQRQKTLSCVEDVASEIHSRLSKVRIRLDNTNWTFERFLHELKKYAEEVVGRYGTKYVDNIVGLAKLLYKDKREEVEFLLSIGSCIRGLLTT